MSDRKRFNKLVLEYRDLEDKGQRVGVEAFCEERGVEDQQLVKQLKDRLETMVVEDQPRTTKRDQKADEQKVSSSADTDTDDGDTGTSPGSEVKSAIAVKPVRRATLARRNRNGTITDPLQLEGLASEALYDSFEPLAAGGLGEVFTANDNINKKFSGLESDRTRRVAIKLIRQDKVDEKKLRMFMVESAITAKLEHPGVVPVYGFGRTKDRPFYVMRLVKGQNMKERIQRFHSNLIPGVGLDDGENSVAFRELLNHFISVCNTMAYAHDCGIIHRDIKPENVMLGPFGETLVVDWGLARTYIRTSEEKEESGLPTLIQETKDRNFSEGIEGTPNYLSPEQADPLSYVGRPTDIYSLGATLYEILTGHLAVEGNDLAEVLNIVRTNSIKPAREVNKLVPKPLEAICQKAMARRGEDRYRSSLDLADDVKRYLANEPVSAYPEPPMQQAARWVHRHRGWSLFGAACALVTLVVIVCTLALGAKHDQNMLEINLEGLRTQADKQAELLVNDIERLKKDVRYLATNQDVIKFAEAFVSNPRDNSRRDELKEFLKTPGTDKNASETTGAGSTASESIADLVSIREELAETFEKFMEREPSYMQARIIDGDGIELLRVERKESGGEIATSSEMADKGGKPYVENCLETDGVYLSEFNVNKENNIRNFKFPVVRACMELPNNSVDEDSLGLVVINMHFSRLAEWITEHDEEAKRLKQEASEDQAESIVYLTNHKGEFLIHQRNELGFSFERGLQYRARDVYRPLARFLAEDRETLEQTNVIPRSSIFIVPKIKPPDKTVTLRHYKILKERLGRVYESYEHVSAEPSDFNELEDSCHGIITGVNPANADEIIQFVKSEEFDSYFEIMKLPTEESTEKHTVYAKKIPMKSGLEDGEDRFLALVLAEPNPTPSLTSRLLNLFFGEEAE